MVKKNRWVIPNQNIIANLLDQDKANLDAQAAQEILQGITSTDVINHHPIHFVAPSPVLPLLKFCLIRRCNHFVVIVITAYHIKLYTLCRYEVVAGYYLLEFSMLLVHAYRLGRRQSSQNDSRPLILFVH